MKYFLLIFVVQIAHTFVSVQKIPLKNLLRERIFGGSETVIENFPFIVSLRYNYDNISNNFSENIFKHHCGGSIYTENVIITAAHCLIQNNKRLNARDFQIVAGTELRNGSSGIVRPIKMFIIHEDYNKKFPWSNDIALIVLHRPLPLNDKTIKCVELEPNSVEGKIGVVIGWGSLYYDGPYSDVLMEVAVPIIKNEECQIDYMERIVDSMLCAGFRLIGLKDACRADSGGPLVVDGKLAGIISWGPADCGTPDRVGVYANISHLYPWIRKEVKNLKFH